MPFVYRDRIVSGKTREFDHVDRVVTENVLPQLKSDSAGAKVGYTPILPNGNPIFFPQESGPTSSKSYQKYFALVCKHEGLTLPEVGLWLDTCEVMQYIDGCDGKTRRISTEPEIIYRFDPRKHAYSWSGTCRRYVRITDVDNT